MYFLNDKYKTEGINSADPLGRVVLFRFIRDALIKNFG